MKMKEKKFDDGWFGVDVHSRVGRRFRSGVDGIMLESRA